jgi:hypothetical protein
MNLQTMAKLALAGLVYIYAVKLLDTFYHGVFQAQALALFVVGLNIVAGVAQLLFFITFRLNLVSADIPIGTNVASLAIVGSSIALLPKLLALARLLPIPAQALLLAHGTQISVFCPWLAAMLMAVFSLAFYYGRYLKPKSHFRQAFAIGATGWLIMAASLSLIVANYFSSGGFKWMAHLFEYAPLLFVTTSLLTFFGVGYFYLIFARYLFSRSKQDAYI